MKKFTLNILTLVFLLGTYIGVSQTLNQAANWPNATWTVTGSYTEAALLGDPTTAATFSFDDDAAGSGSVDNVVVTSPVIDLTAAQTAGETLITISGDFVYRPLGDVLQIEVFDAQAASWSTVGGFGGNSTNTDYQTCSGTAPYTTVELDITGYNTTQLTGFQYRISYDDVGGWAWGFCLTSPTITSAAPPTCEVITGLTVDSFTETTAEISWTASSSAETAWEIAVQTAGTGTPALADGSGTDVSGTSSFSASGLSSGTDYEVYVRAECTAGTDFGDWVGPVTFSTVCATFATPYTQDFETFATGTTAFVEDNCWTGSNTAGSFFWESAPGTDTGSGGTGPDPSITTGNYFYTEASGAGTGDIAELVSPLVDLSGLTAPSVSFNYHMFGDQIGTLEVLVNGTSEWSLSGQQQTSATEPWELAFVDLAAYTGQTVTITFRATSAGTFEGDIAIDNIEVDELPSCFNPSGLTIDSTTGSTATISWTAGDSGETAWEIAVQPDGTGEPAAADNSGTDTTTNPYFALGLSAITDYEVYLRAECGVGDFSDWIGPVTFTTDPISPPDCPATVTATPDVACGNFDTALSWDASAGADGYFVTVGSSSGGNDILDENVVGETNTSTTIPNQTNGATFFYTVSPYNIVGTATCAEGTYTTAAAACLCVSEPASLDGNGISNVRIGIEDFATPAVEYFDHSGFVNTLNQGTPINVQITFETGFTYDTNIWIDLNDNGDLTDPGELVFSGEAPATNPNTFDASFVVPSGAPGPHKMRIGTADSGQATPNPCFNGSFGVTLDFDVDIVIPACDPAVIASTTIVDNCATGTYNVLVDVTDPGTATFIIGTAPQPILPGINTVGPFAIGTTSPSIEILDITNAACNISLGTFNSDGNPVTDITATNVTGTTADIGWTVNGAETAWEVLLLDAGDPAPDAATSGTDVAGANPYTATGLTSGTPYDAYVRGMCGTTPEWVGPLTFITLPSCGDTVYDTGGPTGDYSNNEAYTVTYLPENPGDVVTLNFLSVALETCCDDLSIYDGLDTAAPVLAADLIAPGVFTATNPAGALTLEFSSDFSVTDAGWEAQYLCGPPPTCDVVTGLTLDSVTETTATISWTASPSGETTWEVAVQAPGTGTPAGAGTSTTDNPYTATGLTADTTYEVFVRADCAGDGSDVGFWTGPLNFTTLPTPPDGPVGVTCGTGSPTFIFTEEFNSQGDWTGNFGSADGNWEVPDASGSFGTGASDAFSGDNFMNFESGTSTATGSAVSPAIDLSSAVDGAELSFYMHAFGEDMGTLNVGVGTSPAGPFTTEFTWTGELQTAGTDAWAPVGVDLTAYLGSTIYIEFSHTGTGGFAGDMSIDLMRVEACGAFCIDPSDIVVSNINGSEAEIAWTSNGTETSWEVAVQIDGTGEPAAADNSGTDTAANPYTETGLAELTAYEVYVRADCGSGTFSGWAGPIDFTTTEACPNVSGITIDSFTDTTATISWTNGGGVNETGFEVVVQPDGTGVPTAGGAPATNPYTATGLTAETAYEVYVRADCDTDGFSGWVAGPSFTTACTPETPDYLEDFTTFLNPCWDEATGGDLTTGPTSTGFGGWLADGFNNSGTTGATKINVFGAGPDVDWLLTPLFDLSAGGYELVFDGSIVDWNGSTLTDALNPGDVIQLVYSTDGTNWLTLYDFIANTPNAETITIDLSAITGSSVQFAFYTEEDTTNGTGRDLDIFVDNFQVRTPPLCSDVTAVTVSNIGDTSADIGWTVGDAGDTLWEVAVVPAGSGVPALADNTGTDTSSNPYTASGLTPETSYEVYVRTDCGGDFGAWSSVVTFETACSAIAAPYDEDFETFTVSAAPFGNENCWAGSNTAGSFYWESAAGTDTSSGGTGPSPTITTGNYFFTEASGAGIGDVAELVAQTVDLSALPNPAQLTFNYHMFGGEIGTLEVLVNGVSEWSLSGEQQATDTTPWGLAEVDLTAYAAGLVTVTFRATSAGTFEGDIAIDNISIDEIPSCPEVSDIVVSSITTTTADIGWTNGGSETAWEVAVQAPGTGEPGVADGSGADTTANPYTATGLSESTDYEVYVRAECVAGVDFSDWVGPVNFATPTPTITSYPYNQDFESGSGGWSADGGTWELGAPANTVINSADSGTNAWVTNLDGNYNSPESSAVTSPNFDFSTLTDPLIDISIWYESEFSWDGAVLQSSIDGGTTWQNVGSELDGTNWYNDTSIAGNPGGQQVGWTGRNGSGSNGWLIAGNSLASLAGQPNVLLRVAFGADGSIGDEGFAFDTIFIRENLPGTYTYTDGVWSPGVPGNDLDDLIIASGNLPVGSDLTCNTMTVNPGAAVTVNTGTTLEATNGLLLESSSTSYSSLILNGTIVGPMTYDRHVNINGSGTTGSNDLISAPLTGQQFNDFALANPNIFSNTAGTLYLFGPFEKNTGQFVTWANTETATLDAGVGYRAASDDNDTFSFVGNAENGTVTNNIVNQGTNNEEWNLVGNPYPSYLNVVDFLLGTAGPGLSNIQLFDIPTAAIYGYDGTALNGWTTYNLATSTGSTVIAPGQGFFVSANAANVAAGDLTFTPSMRRTGDSDDFIVGRNPELTYVNLAIHAGNKSYGTDFYFNINATQGFDFGYDANIWGDTVPDFALYSHLVQDNVGDAVTLQALSMNELNDVTIPLGVNANQGEQLTFSIADMNIPASVNVYLEDVVANTVTLLNTTDYVITPTTDLSGTGRFFLRTSDESLSTIDNSLDKLSIFALKASQELVVSGQLFDDNTMLTLYDMQGRLVLSTELDNASLQNRIDVSNINSGVYVVTVQSNEQEKTKKVIID